MTPRFQKALITVALVAGTGTLLRAADGILLVQRVTTGGTTSTSQMQVEKNRMRAEVNDATGKKVMIFDGAKEILHIVDVDRKTYTEMTKADVDQMAAQLQNAMTQMQQMMATMPPEQRAQMEAMMRGRGAPGAMMPAMPAKPEYRKAGTGRVGKWTCDVYDILQNGQKTGEVCSVDPSALGFSAADFDVTRRMGEFVKRIIPLSAQPMFSLGRMEDQGFAGFPIRLTSGQSTAELVEASRQTFPDSLFAVPAGYQKTSLMGGRGRQ